MIYEFNVSHPLILRQDAGSNIKVEQVSHRLLIVDSSNQSIKPQQVSDTLTLRQSAVVGFTVYNGIVASTLGLSQATHPRVHVVSVESFLGFAHQATRPKYEIVQHTLNLSHVAEKTDRQLPNNLLAFTQSATVAVVRNFVIEHTVALESVGSSYNRNDPLFVSVQPGMSLFALAGTVKFVFGSRELVLPRPEPENTLRLDFTRVNRRTRGGDLVVMAAEQWPKTKTHNLTFIFNGEEKAESIKAFLKETLGKEVQYQAHDGRVWQGYIMTPAAEIIHDTRMYKSVNLEFEGDLL